MKTKLYCTVNDYVREDVVIATQVSKYIKVVFALFFF